MLTWEQLEYVTNHCTKCPLSQGRTHVVVDRGNRSAGIMFIGEGPGQQEDIQGKPFVGPAGQLLDRILAAAGFSEENAYIANIVKCRPPGNRDPLPSEQEACINYLRHQLLLVKPKIIVCLGRIAAQRIISPDFKITSQHGIWIERKGYYITAVYHPSALLRDESKKRPTWEDFKEIKKKYDALFGEGNLNSI